MTRSIIVGSNGQDGWFLNQHLHACDHDVWRLSRTSTIQPDNKTSAAINILSDKSIENMICDIQPQHIYFLAAIHHSSSDQQINAADLQVSSKKIHVQALKNFLDAMAKHVPTARLFYAASSHLFAGKTDPKPVCEDTKFAPLGIYAETKLQGVELCKEYRKSQNLYAVSGFLFNHESWRRDPRFLSRKIVQSVVNIFQGQQSELTLHDLSAQVDWSFAGDTVRAMHLMLQMDTPTDLVVASGQLHSVKDFAQIAFEIIGLDWRDYVSEEPEEQQKPYPVKPLVGDASRLRSLTGWQPKVNFRQMIELMIEMELQVSGGG